MAKHTYVVLAEWDDDAGVWFVKASDIPGLVVEAETLEQFRQIIFDVAAELLEAADGEDLSDEIPIWVKAEALAYVPRRREPATA